MYSLWYIVFFKCVSAFFLYVYQATAVIRKICFNVIRKCFEVQLCAELCKLSGKTFCALGHIHESCNNNAFCNMHVKFVQSTAAPFSIFTSQSTVAYMKLSYIFTWQFMEILKYGTVKLICYFEFVSFLSPDLSYPSLSSCAHASKWSSLK